MNRTMRWPGWLAMVLALTCPADSDAEKDVQRGGVEAPDSTIEQVLKLSAEARVMEVPGLGQCLVAVGHGEIRGQDRASLVEAQATAEADAKGHMAEFIHGLKTETSEELKTMETVVSIVVGDEVRDNVEVVEEYSSSVRTQSEGVLRATRLLAAWTSDDGSLRSVAVIFSRKFFEDQGITRGIVREGENTLRAKASGGQRAVRVLGMVPLAGGDAATARQEAIGLARENAVKEGLGSLVESQTQVDELSTKIRVREKAQGYIIEENVVAEGSEGGFYRVTLDALVSVELLDQDLRAFRLLQEQVGMPRVAVKVSEQWADGSTGTGDASVELTERLQEQGYRLVTAGTPDVEVVIEGLCTLTENEPDKFGRIRVSANADYAAVVVSTGKVLGSAQDTQRVAMKTRNDAGSRAAKRASSQVFAKLHAQIAEQWSNIAQTGDQFLVVVSNVGSYGKQGRPFQQMLEGLPNVASVKRSSFNSGTLVLEVEYKGTASDLEGAIFDRLGQEAAPELKGIDLTQSSGNRIEFSF